MSERLVDLSSRSRWETLRESRWSSPMTVRISIICGIPGIVLPPGITTQSRDLTDINFISVNLNHFRLLRVVGKGAFGKVRIVERKDTGLTFALKYIRKEEGMSGNRLLKNYQLTILT